MTKKSITTLVQDIYSLLEGEVDLNAENVDKFSTRLHDLLVSRLTRSSSEWKPALRMSNFGKACERQLWYSINKPEAAEPLSPKARLNFLFGDILEELLLFLAEEAGHSVEGQQDELQVEGVVGHRDAVIDGITVDVKSANSRSFKDFERNNITKDNPFHSAYIDQLDLYMEAGTEDDLVKEKKIGAFLAFDKELGGITLTYQKKREVDWPTAVTTKREMLESPEPPPRGFSDEPDGKSGNMKLPTVCSYCQFRKECWPEVRTFFYANGPKHLTKVVRTPDVPEKV